MNYNERVQALAKEIAEAYGNHILPSGCITAAIVAIRHMADAYEWGYHDGWMSKAMNFNQLNSPSLTEGKIKSGLISDDGQEAGSNGADKG